MHKALHPEMTLTNNICQKKKEKEDLPVLRTHQYNDLKTTKAWRKTDYSHRKQY